MDTLIATGNVMGSLVQVTNKRTKDTSGPGASPHTRQCRPVAKRLTPEPLLHGILLYLPLLEQNSLPTGLQAKLLQYTITTFSGNGQRMRTNRVAMETRPSFFPNFN